MHKQCDYIVITKENKENKAYFLHVYIKLDQYCDIFSFLKGQKLENRPGKCCKCVPGKYMLLQF